MEDGRKNNGQFAPGHGHAKGRPKGSRNKLAEDFVQALYEDFQTGGAEAIREVRELKPVDYVKVCASILPKDFNVKVSPLEELTDEQIIERINSISAALQGHAAVTAGIADGTAEADQQEETGPVQPVH